MTTDVNALRDEDWQNRLRRDGYAHFQRLCPETAITSARSAIDHDLAMNYDASRQVESFILPGPAWHPLIMALLLDSGITAKLDEVIGFDCLS